MSSLHFEGTPSHLIEGKLPEYMTALRDPVDVADTGLGNVVELKVIHTGEPTPEKSPQDFRAGVINAIHACEDYEKVPGHDPAVAAMLDQQREQSELAYLNSFPSKVPGSRSVEEEANARSALQTVILEGYFGPEKPSEEQPAPVTVAASDGSGVTNILEAHKARRLVEREKPEAIAAMKAIKEMRQERLAEAAPAKKKFSITNPIKALKRILPSPTGS